MDVEPEFGFGAIRSPPDDRDYQIAAFLPTEHQREILPPELDLRLQLPPVRNQGGRGTCAAHAGALVKEYQERIDANYLGYMSPEFIYQNREGKPQSVGMYGRDVMRILSNIGSVSEDDCPYQDKDNDMTEEQLKALAPIAENYKIVSYAAVTTEDELKHALHTWGPCWVAFPVFKHRPEFWRGEQGEEPYAGHAVAIVGYTADGYWIRNSWGAGFGTGGYVLWSRADWGRQWEIWSLVDQRGSPTPPIKCGKCGNCEVM